jgi:hypothetical protein
MANFFEDLLESRRLQLLSEALGRLIAVILTHYNYANVRLSISGGLKRPALNIIDNIVILANRSFICYAWGQRGNER